MATKKKSEKGARKAHRTPEGLLEQVRSLRRLVDELADRLRLAEAGLTAHTTDLGGGAGSPPPPAAPAAVPPASAPPATARATRSATTRTPDMPAPRRTTTRAPRG